MLSDKYVLNIIAVDPIPYTGEAVLLNYFCDFPHIVAAIVPVQVAHIPLGFVPDLGSLSALSQGRYPNNRLEFSLDSRVDYGGILRPSGANTSFAADVYQNVPAKWFLVVYEKVS